MKRHVQTALLSILVLAYLGFLLYFLTIQPGGAGGNTSVIWTITGFASGGMLMMAIYGYALYLFRQGEKAALYFSLFCLGMGVRFIVMEGSMTLTGLAPDIFYGAALSLRYIAIGVAVIGGLNFVFEIFATPKHKRRRSYLSASMAAVSVYGAIAAYYVGSTPIVNMPVFLVTIFINIYTTFMVITSRKLRESMLCLLYLVSLMLHIVSTVFSALLTDRFPHLAIISVTMFVIAHVVLLSDRYARAITAVEQANEALEEKVAMRTAELSHVNEQLAERNAMLDNLHQMKNELIATISHETKTPLAVLSVYAELIAKELRSKGVSEQTAKDLDTITDETQRISRLMDELQNHIRKQDTLLFKTRLNLTELINGVARLYTPIMGRKNNTLTIHIPDDLPDSYACVAEITQVMFNLLQNAHHHTENGSIDITATHEQDYIAVTISDTGSGIPSEFMPRLFERGVGGDDTGTGLGLFLCKEIIDNHGGEIEIHNGLKKGTVARFMLPAWKGGAVHGQKSNTTR